MTSSSKKTPYAWNVKRIQQSPFKDIHAAKQAEQHYLNGTKPIGFSYIASLKSMGRIPRSNGLYTLGAKYKA